MNKWKVVGRGNQNEPHNPILLAETYSREIALDIADALALKHKGGWYQALHEDPSKAGGPDGPILRLKAERWGWNG